MGGEYLSAVSLNTLAKHSKNIVVVVRKDLQLLFWAVMLMAPRVVWAQENTVISQKLPATTEEEALDLTEPAPTPVDPTEDPYIPVHSVRRDGFVLGLNLGLAPTNALGTRIKYSLRDQVAEPGFALGYAGGIWFGGALTDWFTFRISVLHNTATKKGLTVAGTGVYFGVDTWPLFYEGGVFQDLGMGLDFGTGSAEIVNEKNSFDIRADGGGFSAVRFSMFYEPTLVWKIHGGPVASYEYRTTDTYTEHLFVIGGRIAFYSGLLMKKRRK